MDIDVTDIVNLGSNCENHSLRLEMTLAGNVIHVAVPTKDKFLNGDPTEEIAIISNAADMKERAIFAALVRIRSCVKEEFPSATPAQIRTQLIAKTGLKI